MSVTNTESYPSVVIVGENASMSMGGEACYPYFFFKLLRERGVEAWLVAHERCRDEMLNLLPHEASRMRFIKDTPTDIFLWKLGLKLPRKIDEQTVGVLSHTLRHFRLRKEVRQIIASEHVDIVHETTPISPKAPSALYDLGVPVVVGPLSGGMDYPPAFQHLQSNISRMVERVGRLLSHAVNRLVPGRIRAEALVVANDQTIEALPVGSRGKIYPGISEVSVDAKLWRDGGRAFREQDGLVRFTYLGRLVDWKAVDLLLEAFARTVGVCPDVRLEILGDGNARQELEALSSKLSLGNSVTFAGWVNATEAAARLRKSDVFVLPSLRESGGIVLLEAMAVGLPVVASHWGGPGVHVDDATGIRVKPASREAFISGLSKAMITMAQSPELRRSMGEAAIRRVEVGTYDWDRKIDRFLEIYHETVLRSRP